MTGQLDDYVLIKLIETYPILYDKTTARGTKNATRKDQAWREISAKINASERACITRWKSIRDRFGKEFRRVQENSEYPMYWEMFQHLLFLKDHYKHGQVKCEGLESIKFEPKIGKRRVKGCWVDVGKKSEEPDDDTDGENVELNQNLIALVRQHPVLYDRQKIRDSKNIAAKNDAWRVMSEQLDLPEETIYKRWKKLRDRFAREYRNHQINADVPVAWIYFNDLLFLESHYRKGVPLIIENLKPRGRPRKSCNNTSSVSHALESNAGEDTNWVGEYAYSSEGEDDPDVPEHYEEIEDEFQTVPEPENEDKYVEVKTQSIDELILVPPEQLQTTEVQMSDYTLSKVNAGDTNIVDEEPVEKLSNVITNMECVLRQSQDCLKALHEQRQRHQMELHATAASLVPYQPQATVLNRTQMLLDGLSLEQRQLAERKIIKFLCECQIKDLNDEEIEDIASEQIF